MSSMVISIFVLFLVVAHISLVHSQVDPGTFKCTKLSPISTAQVSNTDPQVALTHIFCGQVKRDGNNPSAPYKAEGFHSRPNNRDPVCAKAEGVENYDPNSAHTATKEFVLGNNGQWIEKRLPQGTTHFYFFPSSWSIQTTVNNLINVYQICGGATATTDSICMQKYTVPGGTPFDVMIFLDANRQIISAFPAQVGTCKQNCRQ